MKGNKINYFSYLGFLIYFILLIIERLTSVIFTYVNGYDISQDVFSIFVYDVTFTSIGITLILLVILAINYKYLISPLVLKKEVKAYNKLLVVAMGLILYAGLVHTEYTISILQFISYGFLIIALILKLIGNIKEGQKSLMNEIMFIIYIIVFAMSIPVAYRTTSSNYIAFYILEALSVFILVPIFSYFSYEIMINKRHNNVIYYLSFVLLLGLVLPVLILGFSTNPNYFVLIFISLTVVAFIVRTIYMIVAKRKEMKEIKEEE